MEKNCVTCVHIREFGPTCIDCMTASAFSGDHKNWSMKEDAEKNMGKKAVIGEKKALKKMVEETLDMALVDHRTDLVVSGQTCNITVTTYENKVSGVRLSFPGGDILLYGKSNTRKEMVKLFTNFLWSNVYNS